MAIVFSKRGSNDQVTKTNFEGYQNYRFPTCNIIVSGELIDIIFYDKYRTKFFFNEVVPNFGTTNAEQLVDYLADNDFFDIPSGGGAGGGDATAANQLTQIDLASLGANSTVSTFSSSASNQQILTSNTDRKEYKVYNCTSQDVYLKEGATASSTDYTVIISPNSFYSNVSYLGEVNVISNLAGSGQIQVTEISL